MAAMGGDGRLKEDDGPRPGPDSRTLPPANPIARWVLPLVVSAVAILATVGSLRNGFVYDDIPQVVRNPWIRDLGQLPTVFTSGAWDYAGTTSNYYRPMMHVAYTATFGLFGLDPKGFHAVNILLHAFVCLVLGAHRAAVARPRWTTAVVASSTLLFAVYAVGTVMRQAAWASDRTLWTDAAHKSPDAAVAHDNLAIALQGEGRLPEAEQSLLSALRIQPSPVAWTSLGALYRQQGRRDDALVALQAALQLQPDHAPALEHLRQMRAGGRR